MNYGELRNRVHELLENRTDLTTKIGAWINDTRKDLATEYEFDHLFATQAGSTSVGEALYNLPSDYIWLQSVYVGSKPLYKLTMTEEGFLYYNSSNDRLYLPYDSDVINKQGSPCYYLIQGEQIKMIPIPDAVSTYIINYYRLPEDFVNVDDSDMISRLHADAIIYGAALRGALFLDDREKVNQYGALYAKAVQKMIMRQKRFKEQNRIVRFRVPEDLDLGTSDKYFKFVR